MSMADVNKMNRKQQKMTELDKAIMEYECLEYNLKHKPEAYGEDLELAKERYAELKAYFEENAK